MEIAPGRRTKPSRTDVSGGPRNTSMISTSLKPFTSFSPSCQRRVFNRAQQDGGAVSIAGGTANFIDCIFRANHAVKHGGALAVSAGNVQLSDGTLLTANTAGVSGALTYITSGLLPVTYLLPAPLGRWINGPTGQQQLHYGATDGEFPYACAPGLYGDTTAASAQNGPQCTGRCPAGKSCAGRLWSQTTVREGRTAR